jgi:hypothetical protein
MLRHRFLGMSLVVGLLTGLALLAVPGRAGPIHVGEIDGSFNVGPAGTGLTDIFLTGGTATSPQVPSFIFSVSGLELKSGPDHTFQIISPSPSAGGLPTLTFTDPSNLNHVATFDFATAFPSWDQSAAGAQPTSQAELFLASNTFPDLDFSAGFNWDYRMTGVTLNTDNTVNVASGATASFSLTSVPEPSTGVLMLCAGAIVLAGRALKRLRPAH